MKTITQALTILVGALSFSGLRAVEAPPSSRTVVIHAGVGNTMKFDVTNVTVAPGETVKVVLTNSSTLPKGVMGHNWILLKAGVDPAGFAQAAATESGTGYIPSKLEDKMIAHVNLLGPGESGEAIFTAPAEPGVYPFLCSFPGHCGVGMKGTFTVKK